MTSVDDHLINSPDHQAAMAVRSMMTAISELCEMSSTGIGYEHVRANIDDLELSHARLALLLSALRVGHIQQAAE